MKLTHYHLHDNALMYSITTINNEV